MSLSTTGIPTPPTLDNLPLTGTSAQSWEIAETEIVGLVHLAAGGVREQRLAPAPADPVIRRWYTVTLDYRHLGGALAEAVDARLAFPGPHDLAVWKHVPLGYLADGTLAEWSLPWRLAPHLLTPPAGQPAARFAPVLRLGWDTDPLLLVEPPTSIYEAGAPNPGEAWFERGGRRFKIAAPPAAGTRVIAHVVPLFRCVVGAEDLSRRYQDPVREPRRIVLVEAAA
jgi:hypothetical protein